MPIKEDFLLALDTETGGLDEKENGIIEIAAILMDTDTTEIDRYDKKIQNTRKMNPGAAKVNGFDAKIWTKEAVPFRDFQVWLADSIPFGHCATMIAFNAPFDYKFIKSYYTKFFPISFQFIDMLQVAKVLRNLGIINTPNLKLTTITKALNIPHEAQHRAMGDCVATLEFYNRYIYAFKQVSNLKEIMAGEIPIS